MFLMIVEKRKGDLDMTLDGPLLLMAVRTNMEWISSACYLC